MSLQVFIAKTLMKLPPDWLVKLSGGAPLEIRGRTLDPYLQFIAHGASRQPSITTFEPHIARDKMETALTGLAPSIEPGVSVEDFNIAAPGHKIPVRLYIPDEQDSARPLMVYMHMGGGVAGSLETCHVFCALLAKRTMAPVLSVDYRLAPEHKFPAGLEDGLFAYEWALRNAAKYGAPAGEASIGGDSMGGNFAAIISQEICKAQKPTPALQLLIYPATDIGGDYPSRADFGDCYPLTTELMDWFMGQYLPEGTDVSSVRISPAREARLENLPRAIIATAGFDPLVDEGEAYGQHLEGAGVDVDYVCYDSLFHGFTAFTGVTPAARTACEDIASRVAAAYSVGLQEKVA
ncbi:MAG: alpha/beta hydrolase [Pseudomonadota bacterium]